MRQLVIIERFLDAIVGTNEDNKSSTTIGPKTIVVT